MQLGIAAHAPAVLEQSRIVGRNASEERFDDPLDLGVTRACVAEQLTIVDQRSDQIQDQLGIHVVPKIASRVRADKRFSDCSTRRLEQRAHKGAAQPTIAGAVGEQRADHIGRYTSERRHEHLETLIEIAQRAAGVGCRRVTEAPTERRQHELLAIRPTPVDGRLGGPCVSRDLFERQSAVAGLVEYSKGGFEDGGVDLRIAWTAATASLASRSGASTLHALHSR
jgi:hypothetical protein